jgi:hypothetical protein
MSVIQAFEARINGGSEYQWACYGENARYIDFSDRDGLDCGCVIHDAKTYRVYEVHVVVPGQDQAFRWQDSEYKAAYEKECKQRKVEKDIAWDSVKWTDVDEVTILVYARDVGGTYYDDLPIVETA